MNTEALTKSRIYTSIHKLPLSKFQDCICDDDLTALIIEGEPSEVELKAAWENIHQQYCDAMAGAEQHTYIHKVHRFHKNRIEYHLISTLVDALRDHYVPALADQLNAAVEKAFVFDINDLETYDRSLDRCATLAKGKALRMNILQMEIEAISEKLSGESRKPTREEFQKALITLSDHAGRELDDNTLTVYAYCERVQRFNRYIEQQESKSK